MSCNGITRKGLRCKNVVKNGELYCHFHGKTITAYPNNNTDIILKNKKRIISPKVSNEINCEEEKKEEINLGYSHNIDTKDKQNVHKKNVVDTTNKTIKYLVSKYDNKYDYYILLTMLKSILDFDLKNIKNNPTNEYRKIDKGPISTLYKFFTGQDKRIPIEEYYEEKLKYYDIIIFKMNKENNINVKKVMLYVLCYIIKNKDNKIKLLLCKRIIDEYNDGIGYCETGRITRLINIFTNIDNEVPINEIVNTNIKEELQNEMSRISKIELSKRKEEADIVFKKLNINIEEQKVWLEYLLEE
jgi:hypothetical protein